MTNFVRSQQRCSTSASDERELTHMRYSAATGGPNGFKANDFALRQVHYYPFPPNRAIDRHDPVQRG